MQERGYNSDQPWRRRPRFGIKLRSGRVLDTADRCLVMGILNVTPDSFSDGGAFRSHKSALLHARDMIQQGADIIDVGGESTRPGSKPADSGEEKARVLPVVRELAAWGEVPVSVDTRKAEVADEALEAGAEMINDISALLGDAAMARVAAESGAAVCLMHMQGEPGTMQKNPQYDDVVSDILRWLGERVDAALDAGVCADGIVVDPGFGFGKLAVHNLEILRRLGEFHELGRPLLIGASRKSTIGDVLSEPVDRRLYGSLAAAASAVLSGAHILRVHDVRATRHAAEMTEAVLRGSEWKR